MKSISVFWVFCFALAFLVSCQIGKDIYAEITVDEGLPPVFRLSADKDFDKPIHVREVRVVSDVQRTLYWGLNTYQRKPTRVPIREIVYGVAPDGFNEAMKALPLEPNSVYRLHVGALGASIDLYFTYKPGKYSGYNRGYKRTGGV